MVGVEERIGDNRPGCIPLDVLLVDEDTHQFGDGKCWVRLYHASISTSCTLLSVPCKDLNGNVRR